jgi:DUF4097 and DUF4098 domain-containing protein YvlB
LEAAMKKLIMILCALTSIAYAQHEYELEHTQAVDNVDAVLVDCPAGHIYFVPSENNEIKVLAKKTVYLRDKKEAEELSKACHIDFKVDDRILEVIVDLPRGRHSGKGFFDKLFNGGINDDIEVLIKVFLPAKTGVEIETASADLSVVDLKDHDLTINGSSADIDIENATGNYSMDLSSGDLTATGLQGKIELYGSSSDFELRDIEGNINVSTSSGDGIIEKATGDLYVKTSSGDVRVFSLNGNMKTRSSSGDITAEDISGSTSAKTTSGTIRLKHLTNKEGNFQALSTSGDITLGISREFTGNVKIETSSGTIDSDVDISKNRYSKDYLTGEIGAGDGEIDIETTSGDITLEYY